MKSSPNPPRRVLDLLAPVRVSALMRVSSPASPSMRSLPPILPTKSLPSPPLRVELPSPSNRVSSPSPPRRELLPSSSKRRSLPPRPTRVSFPFAPNIVSLLAVPVSKVSLLLGAKISAITASPDVIFFRAST